MGREAPDPDERSEEGNRRRRSGATDGSFREAQCSVESASEPGDSDDSHGGDASPRQRAPRVGRASGGSNDERAILPLYARRRNDRLVTAIRAVCFWTAIVLPFLYLPLLAVGIETRSEGVALLVLLALNAVSLLVGHSYRS